MTQLRKAILRVEWHNNAPENIPVQYNPGEFTLDKQARIAEIGIPGLDSPLQQFVRGESEKLTLDLFFDTTDGGMGAGASSVTALTDKVYQLVKIEPTRHAPPIVVFLWHDHFPGSAIGAASAPALPAPEGAAGLADPVAAGLAAASGGAAETSLAEAGSGLASQRRSSFRCVLESVKQKFTLFSPEGVPLRATLTCAFREYKTLDFQLEQLSLSSPDRTHVHALRSRETLAALAHRYYDKAAEWREIAAGNGIDDPRRLPPGAFLRIPSLR
jgi:nucleoid-associated protein YgaU